MTVSDQVADDKEAKLVLSFNFEDSAEGYPFLWFYEISYTLSELGFHISISVQNTMTMKPLPLYIGWHPYFTCTAYSATVTFDQQVGWNHVQLNSNLNPTGITTSGTPFNGDSPIGGTPNNPTLYDDEYKTTLSSSMCRIIETKLYDPDTEKTVVLSQSANMRFVHIYTGSTAGLGEGAIALEPMSGMADAYNNHDDLSILSGGETWQASFGVHLQ